MSDSPSSTDGTNTLGPHCLVNVATRVKNQAQTARDYNVTTRENDQALPSPLHEYMSQLTDENQRDSLIESNDQQETSQSVDILASQTDEVDNQKQNNNQRGSLISEETEESILASQTAELMVGCDFSSTIGGGNYEDNNEDSNYNNNIPTSVQLNESQLNTGRKSNVSQHSSGGRRSSISQSK